MLTNLTQRTQKEIVVFVRQTIGEELTEAFPKLILESALVISGSVAYGLYDDASDIDVSLILPEKLAKTHREKIKAFKTARQEHDRQIQLLYGDTFESIETLTNWQKDILLRNFAAGLIVSDPSGRFSRLQKAIKKYPPEVYREKMHWLFAEAVFELHDRLPAAVTRADPYAVARIKLDTLRLLMTALLLLEKQYPLSDKHLFRYLSRIKTNEPFMALVRDLLKETDLKKTQTKLEQAVLLIETQLIKKKLIQKHEPLYWIDLRPKYQVRFS